MQNYVVYMQFIIQMGDPFTLLYLDYLVSTSVMDFLLPMARRAKFRGGLLQRASQDSKRGGGLQ